MNIVEKTANPPLPKDKVSNTMTAQQLYIKQHHRHHE